MKGEDFYKYCENFCPIYSAIRQYNIGHGHTISCSQEMCEEIVSVVMKNDEEYEKSNGGGAK